MKSVTDLASLTLSNKIKAEFHVFPSIIIFANSTFSLVYQFNFLLVQEMLNLDLNIHKKVHKFDPLLDQIHVLFYLYLTP